MDREMRGSSNLQHIFYKNASGKGLALLLLNGGDGGGPISLSPKYPVYPQTTRGLWGGVLIDAVNLFTKAHFVLLEEATASS